MMGGRPVKDCSNRYDHMPHEYLDGGGAAPVYTRCDGVTLAALADQELVHLYPLTPLARTFLEQMSPGMQKKVVKAALREGISVGSPFTCEITEGEGIDTTFVCKGDPEGHVRLTYASELASVGPVGGVSTAQALDGASSLATTIRVMAGHDRLVVERPGQRVVFVRGDDLGKPSSHPEVPITSDLWHILNEILPEIDAHMRLAGAHYGYDAQHDLGLRGQYADMYRKWVMLKRIMWEGHATTREPLREILMDMIGHSLLTIAMLDKGEG